MGLRRTRDRQQNRHKGEKRFEGVRHDSGHLSLIRFCYNRTPIAHPNWVHARGCVFVPHLTSSPPPGWTVLFRASIFIGAESGIFTPTAHPYLSLNSADIPLLLQISREGDSALKSSRIQNVNWTFVTCWLIYLSIIYRVGYVILHTSSVTYTKFLFAVR